MLHDFLGRGPYIVGLSIPPREDRVTSTSVGGVVDDIVTAEGGIFTAVTVRFNSVEVEVFTLGIGEKAKVGTVSYT